MTSNNPSKGKNMDEMLEQLRAEVEEERLKLYLERFGEVSGAPEKTLRDFHN